MQNMEAFKIIAQRYGVTPENREAMEDFFLRVVPAMKPTEQQAIFDFLLEASAQPGARGGMSPSPSS